jgi:hypothetical protein
MNERASSNSVRLARGVDRDMIRSVMTRCANRVTLQGVRPWTIGLKEPHSAVAPAEWGFLYARESTWPRLH